MSEIDTSAAAVNSISAALSGRWGDPYALLDCRKKAAATLRALVAERDAARAEVAAMLADAERRGMERAAVILDELDRLPDLMFADECAAAIRAAMDEGAGHAPLAPRDE